MMQSLQPEIIQCPYCWEQIEVLVDCSIDDQEYIEDCSVCCKPIVFSVLASEGEVVSIDVRSEND
jgi:hypothetical protein